MYADYFGLDEPPFAITPDPRYLFLGRRHAEALAHLLYGIREGGGFVLLTGEVGTGKTTLTRCLLDELPTEVDVAMLLNPRLDVTEFLEAICQELGIPLPEAGGNRRLVDALNRYLLDAHARGRRTVLIVDEAQNLSTDVLEQVRLLTNLETARTKLLQILLIGQPELRDLLARNELRQLAQRVTARYHLEPLDRDELPEYVAHRLGVAGARAPLFDSAAMRMVWRYTAGIPRRVNVLCDRALLGAFSRESREVSPSMVKLAAREIDPLQMTGSKRGRWLMLALLAVALGAALALRQPALDTPLVSEPESATPLPAQDFEGWLADNAAATGTDNALSGLFAQWGLDYQPGAAPACEQAAAAGLRCRLERGTWQTLRQFDRPAVLDLIDRDGNRFQLIVTAIDHEHRSAVLHAGPASREISASELAVLWSGEFLGLWRPPGGIEPPLLPGSRGDGVAWLREQLGMLLDLPATGGNADYYDTELTDRVRQFQASENLQVDGIAGEQTLLRLGRRLREPGQPFLSGSAR